MDLISTFQRKINSLWCRFNYPKDIIPSSEYVQDFEIDSLIDFGHNYCIVRRSNKSDDETFDEYGQVREDAIIASLGRVHGNSMNLLGYFKTKYICYNQPNEAGKSWKKATDEKLWETYKSQLTYIKNSTPIFYNLKDIHKQPIPYKRPLSSDKGFKKFIEELPIKGKIEGGVAFCDGHSHIVHVPTKLNYWHIEFHVKDIQGKPLKKTKNETLTLAEIMDIDNQHWQDQLAYKAFIELLVTKAKKSIGTIFPEVPSSLYISK
jgi:hypothetical protein